MGVVMYTDGSSLGNPGPGGYGTIIFYTNGSNNPTVTRIAQGFRKTTNNRMEIMGVLEGLRFVFKELHKYTPKEERELVIYSDSEYVVNTFNKKWLLGWIKNGWKTNRHGAHSVIKNDDLWKEVVAMFMSNLDKGWIVDFHWVKGHAESAENNECDAMAVAAASQDESLLAVDAVYERLNSEK